MDNGDMNHDERKLMKQRLRTLKEEEENLKGVMEGLKKSMGDTNKDICRKLEDILKLSKKIRELREGNVEPKEELGNAKDTLEVTDGMITEKARKHAVTIFPEEVWRLIFKVLSDRKDLWNLCNTSQLFEDILHQWKIGWMFEQTLPHFYRYLPGNKILECRRMCKSWNATVLNFLENHPSLRPHTGQRDPRLLEFVNPVKEKTENGLFRRNKIEFHSKDEHVPILDTPDYLKGKVPEFSAILPSRQNPFIGRHVVLCVGEKNYKLSDPAAEEEKRINNALWNRVYTFLEYFGKDIWYLGIRPPEEFTAESQENFRDFITQTVFKKVPNLRKLRIHMPWDQDWMIDIDPTSFAPAPELESLECTPESEEALMIPLFFRYHVQLRKVVVTPEIWMGVNKHLEWDNLTELHLGKITGHFGFSLSRLCNVRMPNLSKLGFTVESYSRGSCDNFLQVIHTVSSTSHLNTIRLGLGGGYNVLLPFESVLNNCAPSSLKTLEVEVEPENFFSSRTPSYDFLIRCFPLLENLHVFVKNWRDPRFDFDGEINLMPNNCSSCFSNDKIIEISQYLGEGSMYESNVWELLPQLKVFSFQWDVFTREGYEDYSRKLKIKTEK